AWRYQPTDLRGWPPRSKCSASATASTSPARSSGRSARTRASSQSPAARWPRMRSRSVSIAYAASRTSAWRNVYSGSPENRGLAAQRDHLAADELGEPIADLRQPALEQRAHAAAPERLAEDARRAEHVARFVLEALDARLRHRNDRLGQLVALALRDRTDQLL